MDRKQEGFLVHNSHIHIYVHVHLYVYIYINADRRNNPPIICIMYVCSIQDV